MPCGLPLQLCQLIAAIAASESRDTVRPRPSGADEYRSQFAASTSLISPHVVHATTSGMRVAGT